MVKHWTAPMIATTADPYQAKPVKPIFAPMVYKYPETGGAAVLQAAPADAAKPLILPNTVGLGVASFSIINRIGYARIEVRLRIARHV